jgi:hypothetical protein
MPKLCEFKNCKNRASYGFDTNATIMCFQHKTDIMSNINYLKRKKCNCNKSQPCFNYKGLKPEYCNECKKENMIDVKSKKCFCKKSQPCFNYKGLKPEYCNECKKENMIDVKNKKCFCNKSQPMFNYKDLKAEYCSSCKEEGMIDVKHDKCIKCNKHRQNYNYEGLKPQYCKECKKENMINIIERRKCFCKKNQPSYNYQGLKPEYCNNCKKENMINVVSNKCKCNKVSSFNYEGLTSKYCSSCKEKGMIIVRNNKNICKNKGCNTEANKKYKNYCTHCFQHLFPLDPLTFQIKCKTKEIAVRDFINFSFEGFLHDKSLEYGGCNCLNRRRIDHRKLINNTLLCIETDENQHKSYDKKDEEERYNDLLSAFTCKYIFIRFNPDSYSNKNGKKCNPSISTRLSILKEEIDKQIKRIENEENNDLLEIKYLYFDNYL